MKRAADTISGEASPVKNPAKQPVATVVYDTHQVSRVTYNTNAVPAAEITPMSIFNAFKEKLKEDTLDWYSKNKDTLTIKVCTYFYTFVSIIIDV